MDVLKNSANIDVLGGCSAVAFDADDSRRAVRTIHYYHHASGNARQLAVSAVQAVVIAAGGIGNAQLLLQPPTDGGVPVRQRERSGRQVHHGTPALLRGGGVRAQMRILDRYAPPAAFGRWEHTLVADGAVSKTHQLYGCSLQCQGKTTEHELAAYLSNEFGKPFYR